MLAFGIETTGIHAAEPRFFGIQKMKNIFIITILLSTFLGAKAQERPRPPYVEILDSICEVEILDWDFYYEDFDFRDSTFIQPEFRFVAVCRNVDKIYLDVEGDFKYMMYYEGSEDMSVHGDTVVINDRYGWDWPERYRVRFMHRYGEWLKRVAVSDWVYPRDYVFDEEVRRACEEFFSGIENPAAKDSNLPIIKNRVLYCDGQEAWLYSQYGLVRHIGPNLESVSLSDLPSGLYILKKKNNKALKVLLK